jgi:phosphoserine phosphatase RsbU/P
LYSGNDTARRDWLIIIISLLAGAWFFFDYGTHHPLSHADASLGNQSAINLGNDKLGNLGYLQPDVDFFSKFETRSNLLDQIQRNTDYHSFTSDQRRKSTFPVHHWRVDVIISGDEPDTSGSDLEQRNFEDAISLSIIFDQEGNWLEFRNPRNRLPYRLLSSDAISSVFELPDELLLEARNDSIALSIFSFEFDRFIPSDAYLHEDGVVQIGADHAREIAEYYIDQTGWPIAELQFENARLIPYGQFEAAELNFNFSDEEIDTELQLSAVISPAGSLLSLTAGFPGIEASGPSYVLNSLRVLLVIIFGFWLIILLYIRVRLRVIDIKSAILFAVLAGLAVPVFLILQWLHNQMMIPGPPGAIDIIWLLTIVGLSAAFVSLIFFTITVIGESVTRQNWIDKIRTMDLIRIGHFFNLPVGVVFIHSVSFGLILAAAWSAAYWFMPGAYISVGETFFSDGTYLAPLVRIVSVFFLCFITIQAVFLVLIGQLSGFTKNNFLKVVSAAAVFGILFPVLVDTGPAMESVVLNGMIGLGLSIIYVFRDFLTAMLSYFVFSLLLITADGWLMSASPDILIFYPAIGIILGFLIFGFVAVTRGKSVRELPKYVPEYIEDLAQEERIKQELQIARIVQQSFLPVSKPDLEGLDLAAICIPAYETGGDYYDFIRLDDQRVAITVGDVSGKGFQAAFYMTFIKGVLHALCQEYESTVPILRKANRLFRDNARKGTFISLIFGVINLRKNEFIFSRAGHNPLFYYREKENVIQTIKPNGLAIGMTDGELFENNINETKLKLEKGDMLILFTDGIVEAVNNRGDQYGDRRLERMIYFHHTKSAEEMVDQIIHDVEKFTDGARQHDDMTLLVIKQK